MGEDPAEEGSNWYRYAGNDPINFRDPTGLTPEGNPLKELISSVSYGIGRTPGTTGFILPQKWRDRLLTRTIPTPRLEYS